MQYSTRCSVAIHCMLLIALYGHSERLTSQIIAHSTGCNAVTIRGIFQQLCKSELITVRRGTGGATLGRQPDQISIWDIFCAVQPQPVCSPLGIHATAYDQCPVGRCIRQVLEEPYARIDAAMREQMQAYTLAMLLARYQTIRSETPDRPNHAE